MIVDAADALVMADGGRSDYALGGSESTYEPVQADRLLHDGDTIALGDTKLIMLHHPGHTKGSCSFLLDTSDEKKTYRVLIANLPSIVTDEKFSAISAYPEIEGDYRYTFNAMKQLSFDIWLASHASQFGLHRKHQPGDPYNPKVFVDRKGYDQAIADLEDQFLKKIKTENKAKKD